MNEIEGKMTHLPLLEAFHLEGGYTKAEAMEIMENVFLHNPYYALLLPPLSESDSRIDDILIELFINAYLLSNGNMRLLQEAILTELSAEFSGDKTIVKEMLKSIEGKDIFPITEADMIKDKYGNFKPKSKSTYKDVDLNADERTYLDKVKFVKLKDNLYSSKPQPVIYYGVDDYRARCEVLIIRGDEVLLDRGKNRAEFGYSLPGGGIDPKESIAVGAARECEEEALIVPKNIQYMNIAWREDFPKPKLYNTGAISFVCVAEFGRQFKGKIANEDKDEFADRAKWERFDSANLALPHKVAIERYLGRKVFESVEPEIESPYSAYIIYESDGETLVGHAKNTVKDAASDVNSGIKTFGGAVVNKAREIKTSIQKSDNPIIRQFIKWYEWAVNYDNEEDKREAVITGSYFIRLRRIFGKFLLYYSLRPAIIAALPAGTFLKFLIGIVTFLGGAIDLGVNEIGRPLFTSGDPNYEKARNRVIQELELELKMTREKIEDARSAGNVKAKYELMRVENKIESEIMRIKYGSKR